MKRFALLAAALACVAGGAGTWASSVTDYAVYGRDDVEIRSPLIGHAGSHAGDLDLADGARVEGRAVAAEHLSAYDAASASEGLYAGKEITFTSTGARIAGSEADFARWAASDLLPSTPFTAGGVSYSTDHLDLAPGSYGRIGIESLDTPGRLDLSAGDYYLESASLKNVDLYLDPGDGYVRLHVQDDLRADRASVFLKGADGAYRRLDGATEEMSGRVYTEVHGRAVIQDSEWTGALVGQETVNVEDSVLRGTLYSHGDIEFEGAVGHLSYAVPRMLVPTTASELAGILAAETTLTESDSQPDGLAQARLGHAPEPATLSLMTVALGGLLVLRRRHGRS